MKYTTHYPYSYTPKDNQSGAALLIFFLVIILVALTYLFAGADGVSMRMEQERNTSASLVEAKTALIGYATKNSTVTSAGYFPNPDMGTNTEGSAIASLGAKDISLIGKLPWGTLGIAVPKDSASECIWYVISGRFKNNPKTSVAFNWDMLGQIDVIDGNGNLIATNLAALVVAPGQALSGQNHFLEDAADTQCGGNYDARNYLDSYSLSNAIAGEVNYFSGATNSRSAPDTNNKRFVFVKNDYYNDRFLFITVDEVFRLISKRSDFSTQISALLNDPDLIANLKTLTIGGSKGTTNINTSCGSISNTNNQTFCNNWKDMLLLTQLSIPSPITIDGLSTVACSRVLIFGGQKGVGQTRVTDTDKAVPANYLEGNNLTAFNTNTSNFNGVSTFSSTNPSADILRCITP